MGEEKDFEILMDIQNTLGTVVALQTGIQEDIKELKERDLRQSDELEKAYNKAKARQDSIRDDLQHQIDNNTSLIKEMKACIESLSININNIVEESRKNTEKIIQNTLEKFEKKYESLQTDVKNLKDDKKNKVFNWWEKILDKLGWIVIAIIFAAVFKYFNFVPPKMPM